MSKSPILKASELLNKYNIDRIARELLDREVIHNFGEEIGYERLRLESTPEINYDAYVRDIDITTLKSTPEVFVKEGDDEYEFKAENLNQQKHRGISLSSDEHEIIIATVREEFDGYIKCYLQGIIAYDSKLVLKIRTVKSLTDEALALGRVTAFDSLYSCPKVIKIIEAGEWLELITHYHKSLIIHAANNRLNELKDRNSNIDLGKYG